MPDRYRGTRLGGYDQGTAGKLPDKEPGRHRWIVITTYSITPGQAVPRRGLRLGAGVMRHSDGDVCG